MGSPINFAAPKNPAQPIASNNGRVNPYLTSSPYENMQLHTPSGLYYNNGKVYESYTPTERIYLAPARLNPMMGGLMFANGPLMQNNQGTWSGGPVEGSISSGEQWFKPYTGNAAGIINGDLSMVYGLGDKTTSSYTPQSLPNLFSTLNTNLLQSRPTGNMEGASRFLSNNLLNSPIVTDNTSKGK